MISVREQVTQQVAALSEIELQRVASYLAFLRFEQRVKQVPQFEEAELAVLYGEFAEEDRDLAEAGMADYATSLEREDVFVNPLCEGEIQSPPISDDEKEKYLEELLAGITEENLHPEFDYGPPVGKEVW